LPQDFRSDACYFRRFVLSPSKISAEVVWLTYRMTQANTNTSDAKTEIGTVPSRTPPEWVRPLVEQILRESGWTPPDRKPPRGFLDFAGLLAALPLGERTARAEIKKGRIPAIRLPNGRRLLFHWPSVEKSLLRFQRGGIEEPLP